MKRRRLAWIVVLGSTLLLCAWLVAELRRAPAPAAHRAGRAETSPLTDVSVPVRSPPPVPSPTPAAPLPADPAGVPPSKMRDVANPPQGTAARAVAGAPTPPDPFATPSVAQDPTRGGRTQ